MLQKYQKLLSIGIDNVIEILCINHTLSSQVHKYRWVRKVFQQVC